MRSFVIKTAIEISETNRNSEFTSRFTKLLIGMFYLVGLVLTTGCAVEVKKKNHKSKQVEFVGARSKSTVASFELVGDVPHSYKALIKWPERLVKPTIFVGEQVVFRAEDSALTSYTLELKDNHDYIIRLLSQKSEVDQELELINEWILKTPRDVVLSNLEIDPLYKDDQQITIQAHRVFIDNGSVAEPSFLTFGRDIIINTNELTSNDGTIVTFPQGQKAIQDKGGRHGGHITIKTRTAVGHISFHLRGEHGGDGISGEPYSERAEKGSDGERGDYTYRCNKPDIFSPRVSICHCNGESPPIESGKSGQKGAPGRTGSDGGAGGNSGSVKIEVADVSPLFHATIASEIGMAGHPGMAGPPQQGGLPGKAWIPPRDGIHYDCNRREGQPGEVGDPGKDGVKQPDGKVEANCISVGEGFGRCS